jgi:Mor family transcriptional regulator
MTAGAEQALMMLPSSLKELAEVIGIDACLILVDEFGGSRLYIPKSAVFESHRLSCLGTEAFNALIRTLGGNLLQIPCAASWKKWIRNNEIVEACQGSSVPKVAREFKLTERQVWAILKKMRNDATEVNGELTT